MERDFLDKIYHQVVEKDLNNFDCKFPLRVFRGRPKCNLCNERMHLLYINNDYKYCVYCNLNIMVFRIQRAFRNYIQKKNLRRLDFIDDILLTNYQREMNNNIQIIPDNPKDCVCCNEKKEILDRYDCCFGCRLNIMAYRIQRFYIRYVKRGVCMGRIVFNEREDLINDIKKMDLLV
jgi:hypothetical protein